jgi:lauroyl/myristoyl acyltransferase
VLYLLRPMERHARRNLASDKDRRRFDRAKRFVDGVVNRGGAAAYRMHARWLRFLCSQPAVQRDVYSEETSFLRRFATAFGLAPKEARKFIALSLLGRVWAAWWQQELARPPMQLVTELTAVAGWEHFEHGLRDRAGLIMLPTHSRFARLFQQYFRHRGYEGLELGTTNEQFDKKDIPTPVGKRFELARQLLEAKRLLSRGGIVYNVPDTRRNLDNARTVEFFGRERQIGLGFAELALETGARLLPIANRFTPRGFFVMEIGEPFADLGPQAPREERIDSLVNQYARFLRNEWRRYPWNIQWNQLRYYCDLPDGADEGDEVEAVAAAPFSLESVQRSA